MTPILCISSIKNDKSRGSIIGGAIVFTTIVLVICWLVPQYTVGLIGRSLVNSSNPVKADAIVVLLGGDSPNRIIKAAHLYSAGYSPRIVFGTGYIHTELKAQIPKNLNWPSSSFRYKAALRSLGIPLKRIVLIDTSNAYDTAHELTAVAKHLHRSNLNSVLLVTSATHTRRVGWIWSRVAPNITYTVIAAQEPGMKKWWQHGRLRRAVAYEYGALLKESLSQTGHFLYGIVDYLVSLQER